jgi:hypothetical protein
VIPHQSANPPLLVDKESKDHHHAAKEPRSEDEPLHAGEHHPDVALLTDAEMTEDLLLQGDIGAALALREGEVTEMRRGKDQGDLSLPGKPPLLLRRLKRKLSPQAPVAVLRIVIVAAHHPPATNSVM